MLILTRREGESVRIGEDITITVLRVKGSQVRLGVDAPKNVSVQRGESSEHVGAAVAAPATTASPGEAPGIDHDPLR